MRQNRQPLHRRCGLELFRRPSLLRQRKGSCTAEGAIHDRSMPNRESDHYGRPKIWIAHDRINHSDQVRSAEPVPGSQQENFALQWPLPA